ncbi:PREDICTED: protein bfr2 isoform X2 [Fragaria vesca subsp. vesca]|uniref:protein bfr2 isoform X2 n=1 Tax=Fragaria vesca subsp. vesca TaxID=101020 RepID=UPI0002C360F6|nr:PREDICTED: protein bfr2 isoform X2 [Fragaria vesca subsp. vesca]
MEFDDDFELPPNSDEASPPVREKKLKRLKKGVRVSPDPLLDQPESGADLDLEESNEQSNSRTESEGLGDEGEMNPGVDSDDFGGEGEKGSGLEMNSGFDDWSGEGEERSGSDGLDGGGDASGAKRALDFESVGEDFGEERSKEMVEESRDTTMEEPEKKRRSSDDGDEEEEEKDKKKKNKRAKSGGDDSKSKDAAVKSKRRAEMERQEHLKELHAETQRLLRETREAAFKPVPIVQKPISSILEKIRRRKLEVSKKSMSMSSSVDDNGSSRRIMEEFSSQGAHVDVTGGSGVFKAAIEEPIECQTEKGSGTNVMCLDASNDHIDHSGHENVSSQMDVDEVSKQAFRAPIDDTQDLFSDSQTTDSKDENDTPSSPLEEVFAPSKLAMDLKLKLDSAPPDDISSDEEDNDKENVNPHSPGLADLSSSPIRDPVKAFVDDEAEEEDDGDHDQFLFPDKEEDEADEDVEDLNDMIATGYEEKPIDGERRNELHQKWLEQQDASGTEKIMQKLMFGSKLRETTSFGEKHAEEEEDQESDDEAADVLGNNSDSGSPKKVSVQMNLRIAKQMISQMFTDNDVYVSSDDDDDVDDEPEKRPAKPCSFDKAEEQANFLSPAEDESCSEVFGRIKKMNIMPDTKKSKTPAASSIQLKGGNGIIPKSSFIRESNLSLPSSRKRGLSTARCSFIFGRDDSNSMSTISVSEDSSDTFQRETTPARTTAKFSSSQMKSRKEKSPPEAVVKTDASFFEILRQNSLHSKRSIDETIQTISVDQTIDTKSVDQTIHRESVIQKKRTDVVDRTIQSAFASFRLGRVQSRQTKNLVSMQN